MPAKPPSHSRRCSSLDWLARASSSRVGVQPPRSRGRLPASQARARAWKDATLSSGFRACFTSASVMLFSFDGPAPQPADVIAWRSADHPVGGQPAQVQVEIVIPGEPDAPVHLHAFLTHLDGGPPHVGLGYRGKPGGVPAPRPPASAAAVVVAWLASTATFMSAKRCFSA